MAYVIKKGRRGGIEGVLSATCHHRKFADMWLLVVFDLFHRATVSAGVPFVCRFATGV